MTDDDLQTPIRRRRVQREFPAAPFEEALEVALAIQEQASGQKIRRLRLFELMGRSAESSASRQILTNSSRYGLTNGSYKAEWIELTQDGYIATADDVPEREKTRARFKLAIEQITPFKKLHERYMNNRLPAKGVMADFLKEEGMSQDAVSESIDTFLLNAKFVGVLQNIAGAERLVALEYVLDQTPATTPSNPPASPRVLPILENSTNEGGTLDTTATSSQSLGISGEAWSRTCFYITPIGPEGSEQRMHSNLFLGQIVEPALEEFNLDVVRGDRIKEAGMITRQEIQYVMNARLVVADLSFHNPNVFYELALRHVSGLPTVQLIRASESVPFDIGQMRTVRIDTTSIYTLVPQLEVYRAEIANQVRRALENSEVADNPFTAFYSAKIVSR
ncbi:hypothetical protein H6F82_16650 [Coleofasciculus sp. FACHB-SPT9]|nr:hypothetical protein [Coleofasciculus sp. FACHB-SPT9]